MFEHPGACPSTCPFEGMRPGSGAQAGERRNHCGSREAAVPGGRFLAESLFERVEVELALGDDPNSDRARLDRSKGLGDPLEIDAL
jgi:hypothetical protein